VHLLIAALLMFGLPVSRFDALSMCVTEHRLEP
jgi:hypothetical protein